MPKDNEQTSLLQGMDYINEAVQEVQKDATEDMKNIQKEEKSEKKEDSIRTKLMAQFEKDKADQVGWDDKLKDAAKTMDALNIQVSNSKEKVGELSQEFKTCTEDLAKVAGELASVTNRFKTLTKSKKDAEKALKDAKKARDKEKKQLYSTYYKFQDLLAKWKKNNVKKGKKK